MKKIHINRIIFITLAFVLVVQFWYSCFRSSDGDTLVNLNNQISRLSLENDQLGDLLVQKQGIQNLSQYAITNGFIPQTVVSIPVSQVASLPK
jgi:hypothetical protein